MKKTISLIIILVFINLIAINTFANEVKDLTVQEAAGLAIENSSDLKKLNDTIKLNSDTRKNAIEDNNSSIPQDNETIIYQNNSDLSSIMQIISLDLANASNEIEKRIQKERIEQSIRNYFISIKNIECEINLAEQSNKIAEKQLQISEKQVQLGLKTNADYLTEKINYDKTVKSLKEKKISLENDYLALNVLMGVDTKSKYNLILDIEYKAMEDINLEEYIKAKQLSDPNIAKKQNDVQKAKYQLNITSVSGGESYESRHNNYTQALRAVEDEKTNLDEKIRKSFNDIILLELSIESNEVQLKKLKEDLKIQELLYDLGKTTELSLNEYNYKIMELENTLESQKLNYAVNVLKFEKPYLL